MTNDDMSAAVTPRSSMWGFVKGLTFVMRRALWTDFPMCNPALG